MFKHVFIILIITLASYFIIKYILLTFHKIYLSDEIIKYSMSDQDKKFLNMYSTNSNLKLNNLEINLFYTNTKWSIKNNNYIFFNERYYIIEPGYYYYLNKQNYKLTINNENTSIKLFNNNNLKKLNNGYY